MNNIQERLREGKPLDKSDVELLLYTGQQSPYLYWRMRGEDTVKFKNEAKSLALEWWEALAQAIITVAPSLVYSPNSHGHPAARHLLEIIKFLSSEKSRSHLGSKAIDAAFSIASKAMNCPCSTMGALMYEILRLKEFITLRQDSARLWPILRSAILNEHILPKNIGTAEPVSWQLIISLQMKNSTVGNVQGLRCLDLLNIYCSSNKNITNDDIEALMKVASTFRQLLKFGEKEVDYRSHISEHEAKWGSTPNEKEEYIKLIENFINRQDSNRGR